MWRASITIFCNGRHIYHTNQVTIKGIKTLKTDIWSLNGATLYSSTCPVARLSNQSTPSEDEALWLDSLATSVPLLASSVMYVATGQVLFDRRQQAGITVQAL
jgi:hypothetical protein